MSAERRRPKWWPNSITVWINLLAGAVMVIELTTDYVHSFYPDAAKLTAGLALLSNIANIILRGLRRSTQPISLTKPDEASTPPSLEG